MLNIGCHLSVSKGYKAMGEDALSIGANTFQFFTRNPRGSKAKEIDPSDVAALLEILKENKFTFGLTIKSQSSFIFFWLIISYSFIILSLFGKLIKTPIPFLL